MKGRARGQEFHGSESHLRLVSSDSCARCRAGSEPPPPFVKKEQARGAPGECASVNTVMFTVGAESGQRAGEKTQKNPRER